MAQFDFPTLDPDVVTGTDLAGFLNNWEAAVESSHSGAARPTYVRAGMLWVKQVSGTLWELSLYDGSSDIVIANINPSTNVYTLPNDSIGSAALQANAVLTGNIVNLAVTAAKLGANAVETSKILNAAVTTDKIADANVTFAKLNSAAFATVADIRAGNDDKIVLSDIDAEAQELVAQTYAASFFPNNHTFINMAMTLTGNITIQSMNNPVVGRFGTMRFFQSGGIHSAAWGGNYRFAEGEVPELLGGSNLFVYYNLTSTQTLVGFAGGAFA